MQTDRSVNAEGARADGGADAAAARPDGLRVVEAVPGGEAWSAFVGAAPEATIFHEAGWLAAIAESFGYEAHHLSAVDAAGRVTGVLPLFLVRTLRGRRVLVSVPHAVYGGVCASDPVSVNALVTAAKERAVALGAAALDLRQRYPIECDLEPCDDYATFVRDLPSAPEECLRGLPKKSREACRQAERQGLTAEIGDDIATFHDLFAQLFRRLGSPVYGRGFLESIARALPGRTNVLIVRCEGRPVAGLFSLRFRDTIMPYYAGEAPEASRLRANNFKLWKLMEWAVGQGLRRFDVARTRRGNEGAWNFKVNQGFEPTPLPYRFFAPGGGGRGLAKPGASGYGTASAVWKRLPLAIVNRLGPRLIRFFP